MKPTKLLTGLAVATLPFLASCVSEAERARIATEQAERARIEKIERERIATMRAEKVRIEQNRLLQEYQEKIRQKKRDAIRLTFRRGIFSSEKNLATAERSRGWTLLEIFGEEQMPMLTMRCKEARMIYLEAEANLEELENALNAENILPENNNVFQVAKQHWEDLAVEYWYLRYELTDFYSRFKIGVISSDELAAKDAEFTKE